MMTKYQVPRSSDHNTAPIAKSPYTLLITQLTDPFYSIFLRQDNTRMTTSKHFILVILIVPTLLISSASAFANQKGWGSRPLVPELAKTPSEDTNTKKKEKWDPIRFISQSSKFITLPKPPLPLPGITKRPTKVYPGDILWSSDSKARTNTNLKFTFAPLDDVVMGGVSSSTFSNGKWTGTVSDSNSGGFVGIRSTPFASAINMSQCKGIELRLRGSRNNIFKAVVRDSTDFNGVCWTSAFGGDKGKAGGIFPNLGGNEKDEEYTVKISFDELIPTIFARTVPGQRLSKGTIQGFQIAYSKFLFDGELNPKFTLGKFSLGVLDVKAY